MTDQQPDALRLADWLNSHFIAGHINGAAAADELRRLHAELSRLQAADGQGVEPVQLQHMAVAEAGVLRWMTGRKIAECELYAMPDFGRAPKLYAHPPAAPALVPLDTPTLRTMVAKHALAIDPAATLERFPEALAFQIDMARALLREVGIGLTVGGDGGEHA